MDFTAFKKDIDELIADFTKVEATSFRDMKNVWLSKKFSYIFEAAPSANLAFFVQSLYSHASGYMNTTKASLSVRLGGLYCLYCLHETQPFKPPFKIYLSIEVKKLRELVVTAKENGSKTVPALVKKMLEKSIFLFGSLDFTEGAVADTINQLTDLQNARVQVAYEQLFSNTRIQDYVHLDMGTEIEADAIKKISLDYEEAKKLAISEASEVVNVENIEHITEDDNHMRDAVEKIAEEWEEHRERFCQQTGIKRPERHEEDEPQLLLQNVENFDQELEQLLSDM